MSGERVTFIRYGKDGTEDPCHLPAKYEVCPTCSGRGSHSLRLGAITMDEFNGPDWDEDSREMYLSGGYDETCGTCCGLRVILVVDRARANADDLAAYDRQQQDEAEMRSMERAERRMEMGWQANALEEGYY